MAKEPTFEITATAMLKAMHQHQQPLHHWEGGFWCLAPAPADFQFGQSPQEPWIGTVALTQLLQSGKIRLSSCTQAHLATPYHG